MMRPVTLGLTIGGLILATAGSAFAQHWGRPREPQSGACFYRDIDFGGDYFCVRSGDSSSRVPSGTNDEISSIRVFGNAEVIVYRDSNFHGSSKRFDSNAPDLRRSGWNDKITSYRVESRGFGNGRRPSRGPTYQEAEGMVRRAYLRVLEREPDPASRGYIDQIMNNGWTEQRLEEELRRSPEYREKHRRR